MPDPKSRKKQKKGVVSKGREAQKLRQTLAQVPVVGGHHRKR